MIIYRVDERLIHGQVTYSWVSTYQLEAIYIVDDKLRNNEFEKSSVENLGSMSMGGKKVEVFSIEEASKILGNVEEIKGNVLVLFRNPIAVLQTLEKGGSKPDAINVANVGMAPGRKLISKSEGSTVYVTDEELATLKELNGMGVKLYQQVLATSEKKEIKL
jgi:mannose/fructose/N-acetylgalactosamine-specific phosphotransferase system component IIB